MEKLTIPCPSSGSYFRLDFQDEFSRTHVCDLCLSRFAIARTAKAGSEIQLPSHSMHILTRDSESTMRRINVLKKKWSQTKTADTLKRAQLMALLNQEEVSRYESVGA